MTTRGQSGQAEVGCVLGIFSIGFIIALILLGGTWRTEVAFSLVDGADRGTESSFEENLTAPHWVLGLVKGEPPDLKQALAKFVRPGERITEVTIMTQHRFVDLLLSGVTLGIYTPVTITVRGKVGRVKA